MSVALEIKSGPMAGQSIPLRNGESVTVGRASAKAQFALGHDTFMSSLHFAVECGPQGSRVIDRKSSNGTFLNGRKLREFEATPLANGDEIKAGQTTFVVKMVADEKLDPAIPSRPAAPPAEPPQPPPARQQLPSDSQQPRSVELRPQQPVSQPPVSPQPQPPAQRPSSLFQDPVSKPNPVAPSPAESQPRARLDADSVRPAEPPPRRIEEARPPGVQETPPRPAPLPEEPARFRAVPGQPQAPSEKPPRDFEPPHSPSPFAPPKPRDEFTPRSVDRGARPRDFGFRVMGWSFPTAPSGWQVQEGFGLQRAAQEEFPSSLAVTEELLGGITLQQFVESQICTLRGYLRDATIEPTLPPRVGGADESMAVDVRHSTKDGKQLVHRWIYARSGSSVGMLTVTALASELPQVLQTLQPLLDGAAFQATVQV